VNARPEVEARPAWTFLTNHGHVLIAIAADPEARVRDIAERVGITERSVQGILDDLERGGYLERERVGRRNRYLLRKGGHFRHPAEQGHAIDELLRLFR
jgi:DNA-binding MarR family transcriptional regulator